MLSGQNFEVEILGQSLEQRAAHGQSYSFAFEVHIYLTSCVQSVDCTPTFANLINQKSHLTPVYITPNVSI